MLDRLAAITSKWNDSLAIAILFAVVGMVFTVGQLLLSKEAVSITVDTIRRGAAADSLAEALEIGYQGSGEIACTEAAKEGITAFLEKRPPKYNK